MSRVTCTPKRLARKRRLMKVAKGYFGSRSKQYKVMKETVHRGWVYAFQHRRRRKRDFRRLWILRINAASRARGVPYSRLIAGLNEGSYPCMPGGDGLNFWRVPLSLDGTRVAGPLQCASYVASPTKQDWLRGFSRGPAGELLFGVWNNGGLDTRLVLLDPLTLAFQTYSGAPGGQSPAVYSRTRGLAAVLDTGNDTIAWYGPGSAAPGSVFATGGVSPGGSSSELIGWTEINGAWSNAGLTTATDAIGLASGGTQVLALDAGPARAGALYLVLGSLSGWHPGFALGAWSVPLQVDDYTLFTLNEPNTFPLAASFGALDAQGKAQASFSLPPLNLPGLVGLRWWHAAVVPGAASWVSNPIELRLAP